MICGNCGFQNAAGDEFCGSCGQFLAWNGAPEDSTRAAAAQASGAAPPGPPTSATDMASNSNTVVVPPPGATGPPLPPTPPPAAGHAAINWPAGLQRCDVCGTANELSRTFCLNCGAKLKRAGTTTGAALAVAAAQEERRRGIRMVLYAIGGVLLFVVAAAAAFVALGGLSPAATPGPSAPPASLTAVNPSGSLPPLGSPLASSGSPTDQPVATSPASLEPPATAVASNPIVTLPPETAPPVTTPPATAPPAGGFVCSASTFGASQPGGWKIVRSHWSRKGAADTLFLEMQTSSSSSSASVDANILPPDQVQATYGVPGPSSGDVAVVLAFNDAVGLNSPFGSSVGYRALQKFEIYRHAGRVLVVMGVNGSGCYGLASDAWATGSSSAPELAVSIQH